MLGNVEALREFVFRYSFSSISLAVILVLRFWIETRIHAVLCKQPCTSIHSSFYSTNITPQSKGTLFSSRVTSLSIFIRTLNAEVRESRTKMRGKWSYVEEKEDRVGRGNFLFFHFPWRRIVRESYRRSFEVDSLRVFYFYGAGILFDIGDETHIGVAVGRVLEWFEREGIYT